MQGQKDLETTPLMHAVAGGHPEMVEFLIQHGAAVNFHPAETGSALHWAAWSGNSKVVMVLLRHGALVDESNYYGETPLILAATNSADISVVKELIAAGANIHAQSNVGTNAVMGAAWQHHLDTVKLLVGLGLDACAKNNKGETAIDQARTNLNEDPGKHEIIAFLQEKCGR
jgi:ankyrin repeat protein